MTFDKIRDKDLTFYLVVYKDYERARWCMTNLRRHYPTARVVIDVDGDDDERWATLRDDFKLDLEYGERLFLLEHGGAIVKRMLERVTQDPTHRRWIFRIDTDTDIRRRFRSLPGWDYFGTYHPGRNFVQGGCIGLTRNVCDRILQSGCLDRKELATNPDLWRSDVGAAEGRVGKYGLVSLDWLVNWSMNQVNVKGHDFNEVISTWKDPVPEFRDCAVAHPCKKIKVHRPI